MNTTVRVLTSLAPLTGRLGVCANVGLIAGSVSGILLTIVDAMHGGLTMSAEDAAIASLLLTAFTWVVVLFVLCALARFTIGSVALPALFTCLLSCFLLVFACLAFELFSWAWVVGVLIGVLVGRLLCWINAYLSASKESY